MDNEDATLTDRLALGFGCAVITFITAFILWAMANWLFFSINNHIMFPFYLVFLLTFIGFIVGALTLENYLLKIFSPIWSIFASMIKNIK